MKILLTLLLIVTSAFTAAASGDVQKGLPQNSAPGANSDTQKTINGFGASVIVTDDPDWESEWDTPTEVVPTFSSVERLKRGEQATILVFFTNPALDAAGTADVTCDVTITGPDKKVSENRGLRAFTGTLSGPLTNIYLAESAIRFVAEPADPLGEWVVDIVVHDNHRHVAIPLRAKFMLTLSGDEQEAMGEMFHDYPKQGMK